VILISPRSATKVHGGKSEICHAVVGVRKIHGGRQRGDIQTQYSIGGVV
jgi:hypothetical protein